VNPVLARRIVEHHVDPDRFLAALATTMPATAARLVTPGR
jgi:hypothetical protein